jgi:hypothetical protein
MNKLDESKRAAVRPSDLLAAAAAIAAGTQAYGEVVIFINPDPGEPGHFDWALGSDELNPNVWLDITRDSTDQGGIVGPSSVGQKFVFSYDGQSWNRTQSGASVNSSGFTRALESGDLINNALNFALISTHAARLQVPFPPYWAYVSNFSGTPNYMGVRFSDVDGYHYGWIGVVRNTSSLDFDAFAWGYETEPGVPIVAGIPAPGTLAALALGAVVTRRRRKD